MKEVTFKVIFTILFGPGLINHFETIMYEVSVGKFEKLKMSAALNQLFLDHLKLFSNPTFLASPKFADFLNIPLISRNKRNTKAIYAMIKDFLKRDFDKDSVYHRVINEHGVDEEKALHDTMFFLIAGLDTTAAGVTSSMYFLKKYPEVFEKLKDELNKSGVTKDSDFADPSVQDAINDCNYLYYTIKEIFRLDSPATGSLQRVAMKDFEICGVPIPKGAILTTSNLHTHNNYELWHEAEKCIPERFDPEHKYFTKPVGTNERRSPLSHGPFGFGARKCPGQILATIEIKFIVARLVTTIDFDIDQTQLERNDMRFNASSGQKLKMKFKGRI